MTSALGLDRTLLWPFVSIPRRRSTACSLASMSQRIPSERDATRHGLLLVVLGSKFGTGQDGDVAKHFRELEAWTRKNLEVGDVAWRWVNEDYDTADRVPFAGELAKAPGLYVATGFNAWGISNGTAAGILIAEQILGGSPDWAPVYDPMRKAPRKFNKGGDSHPRAQPRRHRARQRRSNESRPRQDRRMERGRRHTACYFGVVHS